MITLLLLIPIFGSILLLTIKDNNNTTAASFPQLSNAPTEAPASSFFNPESPL